MPRNRKARNETNEKEKKTGHNPVELSENPFAHKETTNKCFLVHSHTTTERERMRHILPSRLSAQFHEWIHKYTNWSTWNSKRHIHFVIESSVRKGKGNTGKEWKRKRSTRKEYLVNLFHRRRKKKSRVLLVWWYKPFSSSSRSLDHFNESQAKNRVPKKSWKKKHLHVA